MTSDFDARLIINNTPIMTVYDDDETNWMGWEHNGVAMRWSPQTGWTYP